MRYIVKIDTPVQLVHNCGDQPQLEFDTYPGVPLSWTKTGEQTVDGIRRLYYAACAPYRVLVVMQNGVDLRQLNMSPGQLYAAALVGWDDGSRGYVRRHTKISIGTLHTYAEPDAAALAKRQDIQLITWSELLRRAPRSDQRGGYRGTQGRPLISPGEETVRISASAPASYADTLRRLGSGNISAGVRRAIEGVSSHRVAIWRALADAWTPACTWTLQSLAPAGMRCRTCWDTGLCPECLGEHPETCPAGCDGGKCQSPVHKST